MTERVGRARSVPYSTAFSKEISSPPLCSLRKYGILFAEVYMDISNAARFLQSYNRIEAQLKLIHGARAAMNFTDLVKKCSDEDITVRRYCSELIDYGKLRNAIVHRTAGATDETVIAVPCDDVVQNIEFIEGLLCKPPRLIDAIKVKKIASVFADKPVLSAVENFREHRQKTLIVYDHGTMVGVINSYGLYSEIEMRVKAGDDLTKFFNHTLCRDILHEYDLEKYIIMSQDATVFEVFVAFEERKDLVAVIVTENGVLGEKVLSIVTPSDFPRINRFLESYNAKTF